MAMMTISTTIDTILLVFLLLKFIFLPSLIIVLLLSVNIFTEQQRISLHFILFTIFLQETILTFRTSCTADCSSKCNDMNIPENPVILRKFLHQILFDLVRILILRKSEPIGYALYMCIHDHTRHVIDISANHIGCLSAYSRQT